MNISEIKKIYCIGIKGAGMTAVAEILKSRGIEVIGSDTAEVFYTDSILKNAGIPVFENFNEGHIENDFDLVVYSTAYNAENNVELRRAQEMEIPLKSYPEMLGILFREKLGIAVCGTHGKTTTSAILAEVLQGAGCDPSAIVGSKVINWNSSVLTGKGDYFVAESDEYQNKLRFYDPWSVILTSVDWDHPDFFPDFENYKQVFKEFVKKIPKTGYLVVWGDSASTIDVSKSANCYVLTYGFNPENDYVIVGHEVNGENQKFEVICKGKSLGFFETPLSGKHNVLNCCSAIALCHSMQLDLKKVKAALINFKGTARRFEYVGKFENALLIDDYAHHPDEIKATLSGARQRYPDKKIWSVFHPHTFTRTKALLQEFAQSFDDADKVVVIDIYGSARENHGGVSSGDLVKLINQYSREKAEYIPTIEDAVEIFRESSGQYDILMTMGAGDVWRVLEKLKQ